MKQLLLAGAMLPVLAGTALATESVYRNTGTVTLALDIDATTFINDGTFSLATVDPFKTQNTLNYSNNFTMLGSVGYEFAFFQGSTRKMAANFFNKAPLPNGTGGLVQGIDAGLGFASRVLVMATNVVNQGFLVAGGSGLVRLIGTNISLPFSTVAISPIAGAGILPDEVNNTVVNDAGIFDRRWGVGDGNTRMNQANLALGLSPANPVTTYPGSATGNASVAGGGGYAFANVTILATDNVTVTNMDGSLGVVVIPSNSVVDVAFVGPFSPVWTADAHFVPSTLANNFYHGIGVVLTCPVTNPVTRTIDQLILGIQDEVVRRPNQALAANATTNPPSYSPSRLTLSRTIPTMYSGGLPGNVPFDPAIIWGTTVYDWGITTFTNARVDDYIYASYQGHVDNLASELFPGYSVTNFPGRVEVKANTLDLFRTRIRGEGAVWLQGRHVTSTSNMVLDVQNVLLDLGATNGTFTLTDIVPITVERLHGEVFIWAGSWTNTQTIIVTNSWMLDPAGSTNAAGMTNYIQAPFTNSTEVGFHVLIVNPVLTTTTPVATESLILRATNVVDEATTSITGGFLIDAQSFTLKGTLLFGQVALAGLPAIQDLVGTNMPNVLYFTNNGTLSLINNAHFGDDRAIPYTAIVNNSNITSGSLNFRTDYFENPGRITTSGALTLNAQSAKLEGGVSTVASEMLIQGGDIKFRNYNLTAGTLYLSVTNALFDSGANSSNRFTLGAGFQMLTKPASGDLLGTEISSTAQFGIVPHVWAGEDRGPDAAGFSNNVAIGRLDLSVGFGLLTFQGAGSHNGLYVDFLNLSGVEIANLGDLLSIDPSLTIYFASANLPEEELDGKLGGRLRWVRNFAGPNSSVPVLLPNGQTIVVNKVFRQSLIIDSDADGVPNGRDPSPFDGAVLSQVTVTNQPPPKSVRITWQAVAGREYRIEYATNLAPSNWQFLMNYTNTATTNGSVTVIDAGVPLNQQQRYYRVTYNP